MKKRFYIPESLITYGGIFLLIALSFYVAAQFIEPAPPRTLTLAAGSKEGAYYDFARKYQAHLAETETKVEIVETTGSVENIRLLKEGKADFAFVQSGLTEEPEITAGEITSLGSVYFEPLWIFTKKRLVISSLRDFEDLTLAVGGIGSGTQAVTKAVLKASGVSENEATLVETGGQEAFDAMLAGDVDVVFISAGISSSLIQKALQNPEFRVFSERRAVAYDKKYPYLTHLTLPEGVLDLADNIPPQRTELLASAAMLLAGPESHPTLRSLLVHTAHQVHDGTGPYLQDVKFPSPEYGDFPLADQARRYYKSGPSFLQRYLPFWVADLADRLKVLLIPLITIMFPLMRIAPPTYRWRMRARIFKWYKDLKKLEETDATSKKEIDDSLLTLEDIDREARQMPVPLLFSDAVYNLRLHIRLVKDKLQATRKGQDHWAPGKEDDEPGQSQAEPGKQA